MSGERHLFHSFPRRKGQDGLLVLRSIALRGLLLAPEVVSWPGTPEEILQRRASFTLLHPEEVPDHSKMFGPFSLEFNRSVLPVVPVAYLPIEAASFVSTLATVQRLLENISEFMAQPGVGDGPVAIREVDTNRVLEVLDCSRQGLTKALVHLAPNAPELASSMKAIAGIFYPADDGRAAIRNTYYEQREWRVLSNFLSKDWSAPRASPSEQSDLHNADPSFFSRPLRYTHKQYTLGTIAEETCFLRRLDGTNVLAHARRLLCPASNVRDAMFLLKELNVPLPVTALEAV